MDLARLQQAKRVESDDDLTDLAAGKTASPELGKMRSVLRACEPPLAVLPVLQQKQLRAYLLHPNVEVRPVHLLLVTLMSRTSGIRGRPATSQKVCARQARALFGLFRAGF